MAGLIMDAAPMKPKVLRAHGGVNLLKTGVWSADDRFSQVKSVIHFG